VDSGEFSTKECTEDYDIAYYQLDTPVLVEWIYPAENVALHSERKGKRHLDLLAKVLHLRSKATGLCVLDCLGFILSNDVQTAYGFIYAFPHSIQPIDRRRLKPISLSNILGSHDKKKPVLGEKFQLAYKLVSCLRQLHRIGWLHKNICSNNILFFKAAGSSGNCLSSAPCSMNFSTSLVAPIQMRIPRSICASLKMSSVTSGC